MTAPHYYVVRSHLTSDHEIVAKLPVVPVGTSIRLEFTEDGWVNRGALEPIRLGSLPGPTTVHPPVRLWVDAPSSTPCVLSPSTETTE